MKKPAYKEMEFENMPWEEQSNQWWIHNKNIDDSIITDVFEGQLLSKIQCQACNQASLAFDNFMDLSVHIPRAGKKGVSLTDCLESFISDEDMEKCGYKCSKCKKPDQCKKQLTVWRLP